MDNTKIENLFEEVSILKKLCSPSSNGRLFGGYIRDVDTGREARDIDVLLSSWKAEWLLQLMMEEGWTLSSAMAEAIVNNTLDRSRQYMDINGKLKYVIKARKDDITIDILMVKCMPAEYIKILPISTSLASATYNLTSGLEVFRPDDYVDSINTRQITISDSRINPAYVDKMKDYYPDWTVVIDSDEEDSPEMEHMLMFGHPRPAREELELADPFF